MDVFRLNLLANILSYSFRRYEPSALLGLRRYFKSWSGRILWPIGGYCMAMFLKLEASSVENTAIQSTPGIPDFMDWNQLTELPWFWEPFNNLRPIPYCGDT